MDQPTVTLKLPWLDPDALQELIDNLREAGYSLDTRHYSAAQDLILALVARRERLDDPDLIQGLLGPLLCSSPAEQEDFPSYFKHWVSQYRRRVTAVQLSAQPENSLERQLNQIEKKERRWQRLMKWLIWGIVVTTALAGLSLVSQLGPALKYPGLKTLSPQLLEIEWTFWLVLVLLPLAAFTIWRLWWHYQANAFLIQRAVSNEPQITSISVKGITDRLFQTSLLLRAARELRRHIQMPSTQLDQNSTVAETVLKGGWFTPVYSTRPVRPEYLMLLDRASYQDQRARFIDEWLSRLEQYGVFVSRYYFDGDPRLCFPQNAAEAPLTLNEMASTHPNYRLLIFAEAERFFNPKTGELEPWVDQFQYWETRVLLTPEPEIYWGQQEKQLARQFLVLPGTAEGLDVLVRMMQTGRVTPASLPDATLPLPGTLLLHPQRWLARDPVDPDVLVSTLVSLKHALGDAGYLWLCACAVYPALDWNLTLYLGDALHGDDGRRLLESGRLNLLLRLPWFRQGSMPDWLRSMLVSTLSKEQEEAIRAALQALLLTALTPPEEGFSLAIAQEHQTALSALAGPVLRKLSRKAPADSPLKDHVFTSFLAGRRVAVRVPSALRRRLVEGIVSSSMQGRQLAEAMRVWSFARWSLVLACVFSLIGSLGVNTDRSFRFSLLLSIGLGNSAALFSYFIRQKQLIFLGLQYNLLAIFITWEGKALLIICLVLLILCLIYLVYKQKEIPYNSADDFILRIKKFAKLVIFIPGITAIIAFIPFAINFNISSHLRDMLMHVLIPLFFASGILIIEIGCYLKNKFIFSVGLVDIIFPVLIGIAGSYQILTESVAGIFFLLSLPLMLLLSFFIWKGLSKTKKSRA